MWPLGALAGIGLAAELIVAFYKGGQFTLPEVNTQADATALADSLLTTYAVPFEIASVLLLVAIVGSIWMGQQRKRT
jgi:NADH-quinone oxidoreductase subunit J